MREEVLRLVADRHADAGDLQELPRHFREGLVDRRELLLRVRQLPLDRLPERLLHSVIEQVNDQVFVFP